MSRLLLFMSIISIQATEHRYVRYVCVPINMMCRHINNKLQYILYINTGRWCAEKGYVWPPANDQEYQQLVQMHDQEVWACCKNTMMNCVIQCIKRFHEYIIYERPVVENETYARIGMAVSITMRLYFRYKFNQQNSRYNLIESDVIIGKTKAQLMNTEQDALITYIYWAQKISQVLVYTTDNLEMYENIPDAKKVMLILRNVSLPDCVQLMEKQYRESYLEHYYMLNALQTDKSADEARNKILNMEQKYYTEQCRMIEYKSGILLR